MNEYERIKAENKVRLGAALDVLRGVLHTDNPEFGVTSEEIQPIMQQLTKLWDRLNVECGVSDDE